MDQTSVYDLHRRSRFFGGKARLVLTLFVLTFAIAYLVYAAFPGSTSYYFTVDELAAFDGDLSERSFRVKGSLVPDSFQRHTETTTAQFTLASGQNTLLASYTGVVPDLFFNDHSEIILMGAYEEDGIFHVETVSVLCPTKYQELEEA